MLIKRFQRWIDDRIRKAVDLAMLKAADDVAATIDLGEVAARVSGYYKPKDIARELDVACIAEFVDAYEVASHMSVSAEDVAAVMDMDDVAASVDSSELASFLQDDVADHLKDDMLQAIMEKLQAAFAK
jgi:hypothetical protein